MRPSSAAESRLDSGRWAAAPSDRSLSGNDIRGPGNFPRRSRQLTTGTVHEHYIFSFRLPRDSNWPPDDGEPWLSGIVECSKRSFSRFNLLAKRLFVHAAHNRD